LFLLLCLAPNRWGIKRCCLTFDVCLTSVFLTSVCLSVCLSVAYFWPNSRTERPRKPKIGAEVAHVTQDSDTTFKVKRSKVSVTRPLWLKSEKNFLFRHSFPDIFIWLTFSSGPSSNDDYLCHSKNYD